MVSIRILIPGHMRGTIRTDGNGTGKISFAGPWCNLLNQPLATVKTRVPQGLKREITQVRSLLAVQGKIDVAVTLVHEHGEPLAGSRGTKTVFRAPPARR